MNKKAFIAGAALLPVVLVGAVHGAGAFFDKGPAHGMPLPFGFMTEDWSKSIELLENGVQTTFSADANILTQYQPLLERFAAKINEKETGDVERTMTVSDTSVVVTATSTEADVVERLQEKAERFQDREHMKELWDTVTRTVTNITNGVEVSLTSDNAQAVTMLQTEKERPEGAKGPKTPEDVTMTKENLSNGIKMTITSTDEEKVADIQERAAKEDKKRMPHVMGFKHHFKMQQDHDDEERSERFREGGKNERGWGARTGR